MPALLRLGHSYPFEIKIKANVHRAVAIGLLKDFYYQRVSTDLPAQYAGQWSRPAATVLSSPKEWYDAGDYSGLYLSAETQRNDMNTNPPTRRVPGGPRL